MAAHRKPVLLAALLLAQLTAPTAAPAQTDVPAAHLRYQRAIALPPAPRDSQACAILDAPVFAHAAPFLKDLRLFNGTAPLPYATTLSEPLQQESDDARILNLGLRDNRLIFDLAMPRRPYTDLQLTLNRKDFLATATVSGETSPAAPVRGATRRTDLGTFTLFDLSTQHLARSTGIPLPESSFPYLHVELTVTSAPGTPTLSLSPAILQGATIPPSREAQTLYTTDQQTSAFTQSGHRTIATFTLPIHVPIERISFVLAPGFHANFSRTVEIDAQADPNAPPTPDPNSTEAPDPTPQPAQPETVQATILRVHIPESIQSTQSTHAIDQEQLSIPVAIGSNMQRPATLTVAIDNGGDPPLPLAAIRLEMRQRSLCFDPAAVTHLLTLDYGDPDPADPTLQVPIYDYAKLFHPSTAPAAAHLEPEHRNPAFHPPADPRPLTDRHPALLWIVLLGVLAVLATAALHSARNLLR
jgi:hypothetical protein